MNWDQNRFIVGFSAVMILGCGGLGYLVAQASSNCDQLDAKYKQQSKELQRLRSLPLYPEEANLSKFEEQKELVGTAATELQAQLVKLAFPLEQITPEQFQDRLRACVNTVAEKATAAGVKLPDKFYMGFDKYRTSLPKTEAASVLGRELKAVELTVNTLIGNRVERITAIDRKALPEEEDGAKPPASAQKKGGKNAADAETALFTKYPFIIQFVSEQGRFQRALNDIAKNDKQFFIVRPEPITNENGKPLSKSESVTSAKTNLAVDPPSTTVHSATAGKATSGSALRYIVGTEKLNVTLRMEMVVFTASTPK